MPGVGGALGSVIFCPSRVRPPWAMSRRASLVEGQRPWCLRRAAQFEAEVAGISSRFTGTWRWENCCSQSVRAVWAADALWYLAVMRRASSFLASMGWRLGSSFSPRRRGYHRAMSSSEMAMIFENISKGEIVRPMALPRDLDIFSTPSVPSRMGRTMTHCGGWPRSFWSSRPTRLLKS